MTILLYLVIASIIAGVVIYTSRFNKNSGIQYHAVEEPEELKQDIHLQEYRELTKEEKQYIKRAIDFYKNEMIENREVRSNGKIVSMLTDLLVNGIENNGVTVQQILRLLLDDFDIDKYDQDIALQRYIEANRNTVLQMSAAKRLENGQYNGMVYKYYLFNSKTLLCDKPLKAEAVKREYEKGSINIITEQLKPELKPWLSDMYVS